MGHIRRIALGLMALALLGLGVGLFHSTSLDAQMGAGTVNVKQSTAANLRIAGGDAAGAPAAGTVLAIQGIGGGTAVPVSGTFWQATQPISPVGYTAIVTGQQAVTASAAVLPTQASKQVCIKVLTAGTQVVYYGPSGVTTGTGQELSPGDARCMYLDNVNRVYVIAAGTGSTIGWESLN